MIKINLLSDSHSQASSKSASNDEPIEPYYEEKPMSGKSPRKSSISVSGILVFLLFASLGGLYFYWLDGLITGEEARHKVLNAEKQQLVPYFKLEQQFREQRESLKKKEEVLTKLKKQQQWPVYILEEFANSIPAENFWTSKISTKGTKVEVTGEALTEDVIYQFQSNLAARPQWFAQVVFGGAQKRLADNRLEYKFTFDLVNP
jgi:Tfp pilus assembly protein PilN